MVDVESLGADPRATPLDGSCDLLEQHAHARTPYPFAGYSRVRRRDVDDRSQARLVARGRDERW